MDKDKGLVLIYLVLWVITLVVHYKKRKSFDAGCFVLSTYVMYAINSYLLYGTTYYYFNPQPLKLFPFIYLFAMMLIGLLPVLKFETISEIPIQQPSRKLIHAFCLVFIITTLIHFPSAIGNISSGLAMILSGGGQEIYSDSLELVEHTGGGISNLAAIISSAFAQIGFLLTVYYLTLKNHNKWILILLFISCVMKMLNGITLGQRGGIVEPLLILIASFFLLKNYMKPIYRKIALVTGVVLVSLLMIPIVYITLSRFDDKVLNPGESTIYYLGIENINFNNYALDDNGIRYGDRTVPLFKRMLGFDNVPKNFVERRAMYPNLKLNDESFSTYVGDIAIDFGPYVAVVIICFFSLLFMRLTAKGKQGYKFHQLLAVHFLLYLCVIGGIKLFPYSDTGGNLKIIVFIVAYFLFKNDYLKQKHLQR